MCAHGLQTQFRVLSSYSVRSLQTDALGVVCIGVVLGYAYTMPGANVI